MDFAKSFGVPAYRCSTPEELGRLLSAAFAEDVPALIEVTVPRGSEASPWPFLTPKFG